MNLAQFIQGPIVTGIGELQEHGGHYLSFSLIAQGIELLGACLDEVPFHAHKPGLPSSRFRNAIETLFPHAYQPFNTGRQYDLYKNLRCGLLHVALPSRNLEVIKREDIELLDFDCGHLGFDYRRGNKRLVLVSEDFYEDFRQAALEVIRRIEAGELRQEKVREMRFQT